MRHPEREDDLGSGRRRRQRGDGEPASAFKEPLEVRLADTRQALARLHKRIAEQCPGGSSHAYIDRSDGKMPWCEHCKYTDVGLHTTELGDVLGEPHKRLAGYSLIHFEVDDDGDDDEPL